MRRKLPVRQLSPEPLRLKELIERNITELEKQAQVAAWSFVDENIDESRLEAQILQAQASILRDLLQVSRG